MHKLPASVQAPLFAVYLFPALARIYVELNFRREEVERIGFDDAELRRWFIRLAGFDPAAMATDQPHAEIAESLERALWYADEIEQLDGVPALSFAAGWMQSTSRAVLGLPCSQADAELAAAAWIDFDAEQFLAGWQTRTGVRQ